MVLSIIQTLSKPGLNFILTFSLYIDRIGNEPYPTNIKRTRTDYSVLPLSPAYP